jgi:hypothetical protein
METIIEGNDTVAEEPKRIKQVIVMRQEGRQPTEVKVGSEYVDVILMHKSAE